MKGGGITAGEACKRLLCNAKSFSGAKWQQRNKAPSTCPRGSPCLETTVHPDVPGSARPGHATHTSSLSFCSHSARRDEMAMLMPWWVGWTVMLR